MGEARVKDITAQGSSLFGKRQTLLSLWQEVSENFYCERADFTRVRTLGEDFAAHLMTSYPMMVRRDLGNTISTILRPASQPWFGIRAQREDIEVRNAKVWLEWATQVQRRAMYDIKSGFVRATKEGDHDFVTFGQCVITPELNRERNRLLYRSWHLKDVVWNDGYDRQIDRVHRNWDVTVRELCATFPGRVSPKVQEAYDSKKSDELDKHINCRHVVIPADNWELAGGKKTRQPFVSIYLDVDNEFLMEEVGRPTLGYVIPRWQTVSGSQYAFSPATVIALPDARLIQAMARVILEAGEKATNPPMLGIADLIRGDINVYAGGVTWAAMADSGTRSLNDVLQPIAQDMKGLPLGLEMNKDTREMLSNAFFLNKLNLPAQVAGVTAYEISQRVQEYIRNAAPLFEPMEQDYNGNLCEETFGLLMRNGGFGSMQDIPQELQGQEITFKFVSPLTQAEGADKAAKFGQAAQMIATAVQLDPDAPTIVDAVDALRDTLDGIGVPAAWLRSEKDAAALAAQNQQARQAQQKAAALAQAGIVAQHVGKGAAALADAGGGQEQAA